MVAQGPIFAGLYHQNTAQTALRGAQTVIETIHEMESIRSKVGLSAQKVQEMGGRSEQIGAIIETIDDIASPTNLPALNAAPWRPPARVNTAWVSPSSPTRSASWPSDHPPRPKRSAG
jgi:hypothetical protein